VGDAAVPYDHVSGLEAAANRVGVRLIVARQFKIIITSIRAECLPVLIGEAREDGVVRTINEHEPARTLGDRRRQVHEALEHLSFVAA